MLALVYAYLVAGFFLGFALQRYLPTYRRDKRFWAIIGIATLGLYIAGHSIFPPDQSVGFVLVMSTLVAFTHQWITPILRRSVLPRFRPIMPYLTAGIVIAIILAFVNGHSFVRSAVTTGIALASFGGLWHMITRLTK